MRYENFHYVIADDQDHEDLFAEITFNGEIVAIISQEEGFDNLEIELHPPFSGKWVFKFAEFDNAIQSAKSRLGKMRKYPDDD